jgi:hypothetical protein
MDYLIYILVGWGITDILVNGSILQGIRNYFLVQLPFLGKLFTCVQCSGFWVGLLLGVLSCFGLLTSPLWDCPAPVQILGSGFLVSGTCVIINSIVFSLLSRSSKNKSED